jgi:hypothetical protein
MSGFKRHRRSGACVANFTGFEADLLRSLAAQLIELLRNEAATSANRSDPLEDLLDFSGPTTAPDDPVLARLFPDAYGDDSEAAGDFRRYTERRLRSGKAADGAALLESLDAAPVEDDRVKLKLDRDAAHAWLRTLTSLRLALGTRLEVTEDDAEDARVATLPLDDPRRYVREVYDWLGWLQETLVRAVSAGQR